MFTANKNMQALINIAASIRQSLCDTYTLEVGRGYNNFTPFTQDHNKTTLELDIIDNQVILKLESNVASDEINQKIMQRTYRSFDEEIFNNPSADFNTFLEDKIINYFDELAPLVNASYQANPSCGGRIIYRFNVTTLNAELLTHISDCLHLMKIMPRVTEQMPVAI
jgi:hypothetical protein